MGLFRDATQVRPVDAAWAFALRAGLAVAVPLVLGVATGHQAWAGTAAFGAFAVLYARDAHYRSRAAVVAVAGAGLVACVELGTLVALTPWPAVAGVVVVALVGATATWICTAARVGPPAALMFAFAAAVTSTLPATAAALGRNAVLTAAAAALAWLITMAGAAIDRDAPRRLAVARALRSAARLGTTADGTAGLRLRHQAATAIEGAWQSLAPGRSPGLEALTARAETELAAPSPDHAAELTALADGLSRRGPVPPVRSSQAESAEVAGRQQAARLIATTPRDLLRPRPDDKTRPGADGPGEEVGSRGPLLAMAGRVALGALVAGAVAGALAHVTGLGHPYWAAVSAVAVLQAASLVLSVQRAAGTAVGVLIAAAAIALPGRPWVLVAGIVVAQVIAELLVVRNYGLAMLAVTPLALLVGELGRPTGAATLAGERLAQTVLGCGIGLLCALIVRNRAAARHLGTVVEACAAQTVRLRESSDPAAVTAAAHRLALLLARVRGAYDVAAGEPGLPESTVDEVLAVERRARQALAAATPLLVSPAGRWTDRS